MGFRLVLGDLEWPSRRNGRCFVTEFGSFGGWLRKRGWR